MKKEITYNCRHCNKKHFSDKNSYKITCFQCDCYYVFDFATSYQSIIGEHYLLWINNELLHLNISLKFKQVSLTYDDFRKNNKIYECDLSELNNQSLEFYINFIKTKYTQFLLLK